MAQIETWLKCDLKKPVKVQYLHGNLFSQDNQANLIGVELYDNGAEVPASGTVTANIIREDGATVTATGSASGNKASVVLPAAAYAIPGAIAIVVKIALSGVITTIAAVVGTVYRSSTDTPVDPGTIMPSIQTLISQIQTAVASIPADYSSLWTSLAPAFSASTNYAAGQYVTNNGKVYRFNTAHAAGAWVASEVTEVKLGNEISDLKSALNNQTLFTMEHLTGDSTLPLIAGKSSGGDKVVRRMTTDYIPITKDFEVFLDEDEDIVSFNIELFDASFNSLGDAIPNYKTRIKKIIFCRSNFLTAKYMKIWVCDWADSDTDLTSEQYDYAKQHIIIRPYITVKKASEYSPNDFRQGRSEIDHALIIDQSVYSRAITDVFYENTDESFPLFIGRSDMVRFYLKYYDSNFNFVEDSAWITQGEPTRPKDHPYFKIAISRSDDTTATITTEDARQLGQYLHLGNGLVKNHSISGVTGNYNYVGRIRTCEAKRVYIKDAYIKFLDTNYCYDVLTFTTPTGPVSEDYSWYTFGTDYGTTDKAIRIRDRYISLIFAKRDRTSGFSDEEWEEINAKWYAGTLYKVVESIDKNALGEEIDNGYPLYYDAEMKTTVNTACSKIGHNPVKFAMITDLHDNDLWHLSETVEKQIMAIRDLHRKNGLDFVICGGDLTDGGYSNKQQLLDKFTEFTKRFKRIGVPVMIVRGNHDDNSYAGLTPERVVTRAEFYARCIAPFAGKTISPDKTYYYQDFDSVNTRIICLDFIDYPWMIENGQVKYHAVGGDGVWRGYSDDQIVWLLTDALNCDKRIIVTGHYSTHENLMTAWEKSTDHNYTVINQAMIAYNSRGSVTFGGQTYSFANRTGKVLCQVSGHSHSFGAFKDNGIVWSTTGSPSPEVTIRTYDDTSYETMGSRAYGDITEAHFNMFVCDDNNVHIISFGQMGDLDFTV